MELKVIFNCEEKVISLDKSSTTPEEILKHLGILPEYGWLIVNGKLAKRGQKIHQGDKVEVVWFIVDKIGG